MIEVMAKNTGNLRVCMGRTTYVKDEPSLQWSVVNYDEEKAMREEPDQLKAIHRILQAIRFFVVEREATVPHGIPFSIDDFVFRFSNTKQLELTVTTPAKELGILQMRGMSYLTTLPLFVNVLVHEYARQYGHEKIGERKLYYPAILELLLKVAKQLPTLYREYMQEQALKLDNIPSIAQAIGNPEKGDVARMVQQGRVIFHPKGLTFVGNITYEEWSAIGAVLQFINDNISFWVGDWLNYGSHRYGEKYTQAIEETPFSEGTLRNICWVAGRVPTEVRRPELSFRHHQVVAPLEPEQQKRLLALAVEHKLSTRELESLKHSWELRAPANVPIQVVEEDGRLFAHLHIRNCRQPILMTVKQLFEFVRRVTENNYLERATTRLTFDIEDDIMQIYMERNFDMVAPFMIECNVFIPSSKPPAITSEGSTAVLSAFEDNVLTYTNEL